MAGARVSAGGEGGAHVVRHDVDHLVRVRVRVRGRDRVRVGVRMRLGLG